MSKQEERREEIREGLKLPPQKWKQKLADRMSDQKFLLESLDAALAALEFYGNAPEGAILYYEETAEEWVQDDGIRARQAVQSIEAKALVR